MSVLANLFHHLINDLPKVWQILKLQLFPKGGIAVILLVEKQE
jgi:hypothetical protein